MILAELAQVVGTDTSGPVIAVGGVISVGAIAKYLLARFSKLEDSLAAAREDISLIMGALDIKRPLRRTTEGV